MGELYFFLVTMQSFGFWNTEDAKFFFGLKDTLPTSGATLTSSLGFLLVFYSNHSIKPSRFEQAAC